MRAKMHEVPFIEEGNRRRGLELQHHI
jgi:hypothetical protein